MDRMEFLLGAGIIVILLLLIILVVLYVLKSLGLYGIAEKAGIENPWLAWVPIGDMYIMGKLIGKLNLFGQEIDKMEIILPVGCGAVIVLGGIPIIGFLISIAYMVLTYASLHYIYKKYKGDNATFMLVISIIFAFMAPIFLFNLRNLEPIESFNYIPTDQSNKI